MKKLLKIQAELKCPKGSVNAFGKYKYRSAEQILESLKPVLQKHESTLILTDEIVEFGSKLLENTKECHLNNVQELHQVMHVSML